MDLELNQIVKVNLVDGRAGSAPSSVNTAALLVKGASTAVDGVNITSKDDFKKKFASVTDTAVIAAVETFFAQESTPEGLLIIGYTEKPFEAIANAADAGADFYNVIYIADAAELTAANVNTWNTSMAQIFKVLHVQSNLTSENVAALSKGLKSYSNIKRVAIYLGNEDSMVAPAIVAQRCGVDPARGTWAHKTLVGVKAMKVLGLSDIKSYACVNEYKNVAGEGRLFFDYTATGNYIDETIKQDWLKFNIETACYNLLRTGNNGYGLTFNDAGISSLGAAIGNVLTVASDNSHGYIQDDFNIGLPMFADIDTTNRKKRNVPNINVTCRLMGSIHTVLNITVTFVD